MLIIKKKDKVVVLSGKDKGKREVLKVFLTKKVVVSKLILLKGTRNPPREIREGFRKEAL